MTYNDQNLPYVDLRECTTPRDTLRRIEAFLDELYADELRTEAARLVREDRDCADIAVEIARLRVRQFAQKVAHLDRMVGIFEVLANERTGRNNT